MLQRLLIFTFTLCCITASAQWQQTGAKVRYVTGIGIPTKDTAAGVAADSSQIVIRPADSSLYVKYKRTWQKVGSGGTIGGSGTTNRVTKFTSSTAIGNSSIDDSASSVSMTINPLGNIGIGTQSPAAKLDVIGTAGIRVNEDGLNTKVITIRSNFAGIDPAINVSTANALLLQTNNTERVRITSGGNVGIGSYLSPAAKLVVDGTALINTNTDNGVDKLQVSGSIITSSTLKCGANGTNGLVVNSGGATGAILNNTATSGGAGFDQIRLTFQHLGADRAYWYYSNSGGALVTSTARTTDDIIFAPGNSNALYMKAATGNVVISSSGTDNGIDKLQVSGSISATGMKQAYVTKTGAYTATDADYVIDCTSGTFTVTLPASSGRTGRILIIKNSGAGTITVDGNASETIDGAATYSLATQYATVQIVSDGTNWKIISKF